MRKIIRKLIPNNLFIFQKRSAAIILSLFLILIVGVGSLLVYDYVSASQLMREADSLVAAGKYSDAIGKYSSAMAKWFSDKSEIQQKIDHTKNLETTEANFQKCRGFYEKKDYENAISACNMVKKEDRHYSEAVSIILNLRPPKTTFNVD
ncbi:hypothetical protein A3A48_01215 [Candidatus Curtissbacteria bacterium RIFCSPLOWO2_01_FULL_37_9]|uniref:Uncharacterized protein n=1 Tax=Candidatus Curtissbacteria bacterium RIFCSPLOWO2_01_FULL_37_9 TaxID=1797724 RepID=A0A1F5GQT6_9BACT|nr:MAG: hypothetical protein A3A48_01215 [Candidatus Curtissbacteria bacterium RIFCSPLOWO2_01_FULL_37_9]